MSECFSHQLRLDQIRDGERVDLVANDGERRTIAKDLGLEDWPVWLPMRCSNDRAGWFAPPAGSRRR